MSHHKKYSDRLSTFLVPSQATAWIIAIPFCLFVCTSVAAAPSQKVIYLLPGGKPGSNPINCTLIIDKSGALYGSASGQNSALPAAGGAIFRLTPPVGGTQKWTVSNLYEFNGTKKNPYNKNPQAGLTMDSNGNLYGVTGHGAVFELSPPSPEITSWTETVLATNVGVDAEYGLTSGLLLASNGILYGVAEQAPSDSNGLVFSLSPPSQGQTAWTLTTLYSFLGGSDGTNPGQVL